MNYMCHTLHYFNTMLTQRLSVNIFTFLSHEERDPIISRFFSLDCFIINWVHGKILFFVCYIMDHFEINQGIILSFLWEKMELMLVGSI